MLPGTAPQGQVPAERRAVHAVPDGPGVRSAVLPRAEALQGWQEDLLPHTPEEYWNSEQS